MSVKKNFFARSISTKLIALFLAISIIPILIIGILSNNRSGNAIEDEVFNKLSSVGSLKQEQVVSFLERKLRDIDVLAKSQNTLNAFSKLKEYHDTGGATPEGPFNAASDRFRTVYDEINPYFKNYVEAYGFDDVYFICAAHGHVMYTVSGKADLGINLSTGMYKHIGLAKLWQDVVRTQKHVFIDFNNHEPTGANAAFIGTPVFDTSGNLIAVMALQISTLRINGIMIENTGLGETGETYLVGYDNLMRSDSRFETETTILKKKIDSESVTLGKLNKSGIHIIKDYRDINVLSYYSDLGLEEKFGVDFDWILMAEIDEAEALSPIKTLRNQILLIGLIIAAIVAILAFLFARYFTKPIIQLTGFSKLFALGDLSSDISINQADEIGELADSFKLMQKNLREKATIANQIAGGNMTIDVKPLSENDTMGIAFASMVDNLRSQITGINNGVNVISSSASEIMATIAQLASGAAETATSISETTSTIAEVKQTAEVSNQKATNVSESSQLNRQASLRGTKSIADTVKGMNRIKEQMLSIADIVVRLSSHSKLIGEISNTVSDIAEQSNLLAVNASIEAAKAGDQGKGFGVVAQEIKNLAERSKESTRQIQNIVGDIQKSINSTVMATELGEKAVNEGLELTAIADEVIKTLAFSVNEAAQASIQIASSSQQQLIGMDQINAAMENIKEASIQTATSTKQ